MSSPHNHDDQNHDRNHDPNDDHSGNPNQGANYDFGGHGFMIPPRDPHQYTMDPTMGVMTGRQQQYPQQPIYSPYHQQYIQPGALVSSSMHNSPSYGPSSTHRFGSGDMYGHAFNSNPARPRFNSDGTPGMHRAGPIPLNYAPAAIPMFPPGTNYTQQIGNIPDAAHPGDYHEEQNEDDQELEGDDEHLDNQESESESEYKPSPVKNQTPRKSHTGGKYPRKATPKTPGTARKTPRSQSTKKQGEKAVWGGNFASIADMKAAKDKRVADLVAGTDSNRSGIVVPSDADLPEYARRLFNAMVYEGPEGVDDHPLNNKGKPCQALQAIERGHWPAAHIEERAWELLDALLNRGAAFGARLLPPFFKFAHEDATRHADFEQRFAAIEAALRRSKATVKNILDPQGHIERLVDAPHAIIRQKENNKKVNAQRDEQNKIGREELRRRKQRAELNKIPPPANDAEEDPQISDEDTKPSVEVKHVPMKRPRQSNTRTRTPKVAPAAVDEENNGDEESPAKRRQSARIQRAAPKSGGKKPSKPNPQLTARRSQRNNPNPPAAPEEEDQYKRILAGLLQIDPEYAMGFQLRDLRIYARAYYDHPAPWTNPDNDRYFSPRGPFLILITGAGEKEHLAHSADVFWDLATARNDDMNYVDDLRNVDFIPPVTTDVEKRALGMIRNPFGTVHGLYGIGN